MGDPLRSLGALAVQGRPVPFEGFEDLIGFVIVFFAVIWPVIRGLLSAARTNRADFDRRSGRGGSGERPNSLEAFLEGLRDGDDDEEDLTRQRREARAERRERQLHTERDRREQRQRMPAGPQVDPFGEDDEEPAASAPARAEARTVTPAAPGPATGSGRPSAPPSAPRPAPAPLPASSSARRSRPVEPVDGFEVSIDDHLDQVPSEDALEAGLLPTGGRDAGGRPAQRAADREPDEEGLEVVAGAGEEAAFALPGERASALERIGGGRTPWQSAVLMKEILGPPVSLAPHDEHLR